jgi:hypothetical protein
VTVPRFRFGANPAQWRTLAAPLIQASWMCAFHKGLFVMAIACVATSTLAQTARDIRGPTPLIAIENEPPPKLIVDPPLPGPLAQGRVFIQYRTEHLRVLPVFGTGALQVSPRIGHIHITVDDAPWHFVDASGETIIVVGLPAGPHAVLIELADPTHKVITQERVWFVVPQPASPPAKP